jgi:hypothetical protein
VVLRPAIGAEALARIWRVSDAGAAEIAPKPPVEPGNAPLAVRAVHPWPLAAQMHSRPRHPDVLGGAVTSQVLNEPISRDAHAHYARPFQARADGDPTFAEKALASQEAHVEAIACQLFDREAV